MAISNIYNAFVREASGPLAIVRVCKICGHFETVKKGIPGVGRSYGMREGNKARGRIIQHIKDNHPESVNDLKNERG